MPFKNWKEKRFSETGAFKKPEGWIWVDHPTHSDWYQKEVINQFIISAKKYGIDPYDFIALGISETGLGNQNPGNPARINFAVHPSYSIPPPEFTTSPKVFRKARGVAIDNAAEILAKQLKKYKDKESGIQAYSGTGRTLYGGGTAGNWFGKPLAGQDMWKEKPHAKRVLDISSKIRENPQIKSMVNPLPLGMEDIKESQLENPLPESGTSSLIPRQYGGPVEPGKSYLVGEKGPEILTSTNRGGTMPLYDEGLSRAKEWVNNYMMNNLAPNLAMGGVIPPTTDMGPMGTPSRGMNLPSAPQTKPSAGGGTPAPQKPMSVPVPPRPQETISMGQLSSVPDYVARFLVDLGRKIMGLPEGGMQPPTENPAMGLPSGPQQTQPYLVGEGGPELFTPQASGQITPISRQYGTPEGEIDTPTGPVQKAIPQFTSPTGEGTYTFPSWGGGELPEGSTSMARTPTRIFPESWNVFPPGSNIGNILTRKPTPGFEFEKSIFGEPSTEMVRGPTGTYEQVPTAGFTARPYVGPAPWRNVPTTPAPTPSVPSTPEGLAKWGITRDILPTGETRYTLPGTEGTMTLPSGWNAAEEGRKGMAGMKEGVVYGGYPSRPMELPTAPESRIGINPEQARYDAYLADKELRETAGISPRRGMAEYEYGAAGMRMTKGERKARVKSEGELAKQYYADVGALERTRLEHGPTSPESKLRLAQAGYYTERPDIERTHYAEYAQARVDAAKEATARKIQETTDKAEQKLLTDQARLHQNIMVRHTGKNWETQQPEVNWDEAIKEINQRVDKGLLDETYRMEPMPVKKLKYLVEGKGSIELDPGEVVEFLKRYPKAKKVG